jgi:hypothetical protein
MLRWFARIGAALRRPIPAPGQAESDAATHGSADDVQPSVPVATSSDAKSSDAKSSDAKSSDAKSSDTTSPDAAEPVSAAPSTGPVEVQIVEAEITQEAVPVATPCDDAAARATSTTALPVDEQIVEVARPRAAAPGALEQQEIQRRRELVRTFFNDFWHGRDDKPATFQERLDQAETYINERLVAGAEGWRLDADARKVLSLPSRSTRSAGKTSRAS